MAVMTRDHWFQSAGIVLSLALSGGAMISISTWNLSNKIAEARADAAMQIAAARTDAAQQIALIVAKQAADEMHITAMEALEREHHADELSSRSTISQQLNAVIQGVADVRVAVGAREHVSK